MRSLSIFGHGSLRRLLRSNASGAAARFGVSAASVSRWRRLEREKGDVRPGPLGGDRRSGRIEAEAEMVLGLLAETPGITVEELRAALATHGHAFGYGTLQRLGNWGVFPPSRFSSVFFQEIHADPEAIEKRQRVGPGGEFLVEPVSGIDVALGNIARKLRHWESRGYGQWAVVEKATGRVIGCVGFYYPEGWPGVDLNWILHRSRRGNGFATEACRAALQWAWQSGRIDHVISLISPDNLPSIRIATRIGEQFERADVDPIDGLEVHIYGIHRPMSAITRL